MLIFIEAKRKEVYIMKRRIIAMAAAMLMMSLLGAGCEARPYTADSEPESSSAAQSAESAAETDTEKDDPTPEKEETDTETVEPMPENEETDTQQTQTSGGEITAAWAADAADTVTEYDTLEYEGSDSEWNTDVMFTANADVTDFTLLSVSMTDVDEDGTVHFDSTELARYGDLKKGSSLLVSIGFPGDLPTSGISYKAADGTVKTYALLQSGKDGSLIMDNWSDGGASTAH